MKRLEQQLNFLYEIDKLKNIFQGKTGGRADIWLVAGGSGNGVDGALVGV